MTSLLSRSSTGVQRTGNRAAVRARDCKEERNERTLLDGLLNQWEQRFSQDNEAEDRLVSGGGGGGSKMLRLHQCSFLDQYLDRALYQASGLGEVLLGHRRLLRRMTPRTARPRIGTPHPVARHIQGAAVARIFASARAQCAETVGAVAARTFQQHLVRPTQRHGLNCTRSPRSSDVPQSVKRAFNDLALDVLRRGTRGVSGNLNAD